MGFTNANRARKESLDKHEILLNEGEDGKRNLMRSIFSWALICSLSLSLGCWSKASFNTPAVIYVRERVVDIIIHWL